MVHIVVAVLLPVALVIILAAVGVTVEMSMEANVAAAAHRELINVFDTTLDDAVATVKGLLAAPRILAAAVRLQQQSQDKDGAALLSQLTPNTSSSLSHWPLAHLLDIPYSAAFVRSVYLTARPVLVNVSANCSQGAEVVTTFCNHSASECVVWTATFCPSATGPSTLGSITSITTVVWNMVRMSNGSVIASEPPIRSVSSATEEPCSADVWWWNCAADVRRVWNALSTTSNMTTINGSNRAANIDDAMLFRTQARSPSGSAVQILDYACLGHCSSANASVWLVSTVDIVWLLRRRPDYFVQNPYAAGPSLVLVDDDSGVRIHLSPGLADAAYSDATLEYDTHSAASVSRGACADPDVSLSSHWGVCYAASGLSVESPVSQAEQRQQRGLLIGVTTATCAVMSLMMLAYANRVALGPAAAFRDRWNALHHRSAAAGANRDPHDAALQLLTSSSASDVLVSACSSLSLLVGGNRSGNTLVQLLDKIGTTLNQLQRFVPVGVFDEQQEELIDPSHPLALHEADDDEGERDAVARSGAGGGTTEGQGERDGEKQDRATKSFLVEVRVDAATASVQSAASSSLNATMFGVLPPTAGGGGGGSSAEDSNSLASSMSLGISSLRPSQRLIGVGRKRRGAANHFRDVVCTALHISLPFVKDTQALNAQTAEIMDVAIQAIVSLQGYVDHLEPGRIVAYFGIARTHSTESSNPLRPNAAASTAVPSRRMSDPAMFLPADRLKSPVRAICCCFAILAQLKSEHLARNISFFVHKGSFLYGDFGNADKLSRVVFSTKASVANSLFQLNQQVLGVQVLCTTRAARVIEGSYRRAGELNRSVIVAPVDNVQFCGHWVPTTTTSLVPPLDDDVVSVDSSVASDSVPMPRQRNVFGDTFREEHTWLFTVFLVEAQEQQRDVSQPLQRHWLNGSGSSCCGPERPLSLFSSDARASMLKKLYRAFTAFCAGVATDGGVSGANQAAGANNVSPPRTADAPPFSTVLEVKDALVKLGKVKELGAIVQNFLFALDEMMALPSSAEGRDGGVKAYCRHEHIRWQLFGLPSLIDVHRARMREQAAKVEEYQGSTSIAVASVQKALQMKQRHALTQHTTLVIPDVDLVTPLGDRNGGDVDASAAGPEVATRRHLVPTFTHVASIEQEGGFALFDMFLPQHQHGEDLSTLPCDFKGLRQLQDDATKPNPSPEVAPLSPSDAAMQQHQQSRLSTPPPIVATVPKRVKREQQLLHDVLEDIGDLPIIIRDNQLRSWRRSRELIGFGSYSTVYAGLSSDGATVALKCVSLLDRHVVPSDLEREVNHACAFHHEHVVRYLGWVLLKQHLVMVMEMVSGGSLHGVIQRCRETIGCVPRQVCVKYARDILRGLAFLHDKGLVHCDVKPHNVLIAADGKAKISDFGSLVRGGGNEFQCDGGSAAAANFRGTAWYTAPEVASGAPPNCASDVFAFGVLLVEMATGGGHPWVLLPEHPSTRHLSADDCRNIGWTLGATDAVQNEAILEAAAVAAASSSSSIRAAPVGHNPSGEEKRSHISLRVSLQRELKTRQHVFLALVAEGGITVRLTHPLIREDPLLLALLTKCLCLNPLERGSCSELLALEYFH